MIERTTKTYVVEKAVCDLTGKDLGDYGWVIVRRGDGMEVAHFAWLTMLIEQGSELYDAAWAGSTSLPEYADDEVLDDDDPDDELIPF